jgi:hypothetical protein
MVVWQLPAAISESWHHFKYRLAFVVDGKCVLRFDNEAGKSDHKHIGTKQVPYTFVSVERVIADFWREIENWRH